MGLAILVVASGEELPKFEVASIKPCSAESSSPGGAGTKSAGRGGGSSPGRLVLHCQTVRSMVQQAYGFYANGRRLPVLPPNFRSEPISGEPGWVDSERYEINAKAEGSPRMEMMNGPMLQALLEDRFKLRVHRETREVPVYTLTVAKGGIKLQRVEEGGCVPLDMDKVQAVLQPGEARPNFCGAGGVGRKGANRTVETRGNSVENFARMLGSVLDRPVIDKTGLTGMFNFRLEFAPDQSTPRFPMPGAGEPAGGGSIFTAVQEQLGLKLEAGKGPGEFLVIDRAERPTEN
jgi:uncharacterized protein (TIGR03435 family)